MILSPEEEKANIDRLAAAHAKEFNMKEPSYPFQCGAWMAAYICLWNELEETKRINDRLEQALLNARKTIAQL